MAITECVASELARILWMMAGDDKIDSHTPKVRLWIAPPKNKHPFYIISKGLSHFTKADQFLTSDIETFLRGDMVNFACAETIPFILMDHDRNTKNYGFGKADQGGRSLCNIDYGQTLLPLHGKCRYRFSSAASGLNHLLLSIHLIGLHFSLPILTINARRIPSFSVLSTNVYFLLCYCRNLLFMPSSMPSRHELLLIPRQLFNQRCFIKHYWRINKTYERR
jgi:hypothetical protein